MSAQANNQLSKLGSYEFLAEPFHCDFKGQLLLGHLGNHMLNAADFHSTDRGFGMKYLMTINRAWVLSRLAIEMEEMPEQYDRFVVATWVENAMRYFTQRNFRVSTPEGRVLGYGRSVWAMIDTESRQPTDILSVNDGSINQWIDKETVCPVDKGGRVKMSDDAEFVHTIDTYYNDVDINGHINSVKYIEHVLDLWSLDWYRCHAIKRFEIAYVAEAHAGDRLSFYRETVPTPAVEPVDSMSADGEHTFCVRITKDDSTECCRAKVVFKTL